MVLGVLGEQRYDQVAIEGLPRATERLEQFCRPRRSRWTWASRPPPLSWSRNGRPPPGRAVLGRAALPRRYPFDVQITFLGQAGLFIETAGRRSSATPGSIPSFFASWFPFPRNDGIDPARIGHPTYLYVSHLHHDHFDPEWLRDHFDKDATVLLPAYPLDTCARRCGARVPRFLETVERLEPFHAEAADAARSRRWWPRRTGRSAIRRSSSTTARSRLLNMNDSRPPDPDLLLAAGPARRRSSCSSRARSGTRWSTTAPTSAAGPGHKKRVAQLARAFRYIELLDPRVRRCPRPGRPASSTTTCSSSTTSRRRGQHLP